MIHEKHMEGGGNMPLTAKGSKIMKSMKKQYGAKKGKSVFYASRNKGKIKGVDMGEHAKKKMVMSMRAK